VASDAAQSGRSDRERFAQQHIHALEPKLSRLTIVVDPPIAALPSLEVRRDGTPLGPAGWGTAAPVDPGLHQIEVKASGKKPWSTTVTIGIESDTQTVDVPPLDDLPAEPETTPHAADATPPAADSKAVPETVAVPAEAVAVPSSPEVDRAAASAGHTQRVFGLVLGGGGLLAAGLGTYFGLSAISKSNDANARCPDPHHCGDAATVALNHDARMSALGADVTFGAAAALVTTGAFVFFLAPATPAPATPASTARAVRVVPTFSASGGTLMVDGRF